MDGGILVEKGQVKNLLRNPKSYFYTYLQETDLKSFRIIGQLYKNQDNIRNVENLNQSRESNKMDISVNNSEKMRNKDSNIKKATIWSSDQTNSLKGTPKKFRNDSITIKERWAIII